MKAKGEAAVHKWIDDQIEGTTVTVVLIGSETSERDYVHYEITESWTEGNGLLGVYIHNIKDSPGKTATKGKNPFLTHSFTRGGKTVTIPVYDWQNDDGRENLGDWIEAAAKAAGR